MSNKNRREFLTQLGMTVGALAAGKDLAHALPSLTFDQKDKLVAGKPSILNQTVDFRYAPPWWQSTYCFPDDPYKSLVGKKGELLYGHAGIGHPLDEFPHIVKVELEGEGEGTYVEQKLEAPGIPIITTILEWKHVRATLTSFATNAKDEGRVDNLLVVFQPKTAASSKCSPEISITSKSQFAASSVDDSHSSRERFGLVQLGGESPSLFMVIDSPIETLESEGVHRYKLKSETVSSTQSLQYFLRFPQQKQSLEELKDNYKRPDEHIIQTRFFWSQWKPFEGKVNWSINDTYQKFLVASARNILEAREVKDGKKIFQVGPTVYRGLWVIDGTFLLEAARYMGYDQEAQEGLESIWSKQSANGAISAGAGDTHWKDTAAAVYALVRQAELAQNWDYFNEIYPDAYKAMMYLQNLQQKALNNGTPNGNYGLLPAGFGDSGIGGTSAEFTNSLWTIIALKAILEVADRFYLQKRMDLRQFITDMQLNMTQAARAEMRQHPNGFSYLPMLMKDDPKWQEKEEQKKPKPQAAQIYLSQTIYPGLVYPRDEEITKGHIELMKAITKEDIPAETGWLSNNALWPYNAPIVAQVYLWAGYPDLARRTFIGFLNHASPLFAWREEQSLHDAKVQHVIGDMPHNWASAECIRYLRHMMILEDGVHLRLLHGIGVEELAAKKPLTLTYSPTRWGRVTISHEPLDAKHWVTKFKREDFDSARMPKISRVILPRKLPVNIQFDKITGTKAVKNGPDVFIDASLTSWEATWIDFSR